MESDPRYAQRITGYPPGPSDALSLLLSRPPGLAESDKLACGVFEAVRAGAVDGVGGVLVAVIDVLLGWPDEYTAHLGPL